MTEVEATTPPAQARRGRTLGASLKAPSKPRRGLPPLRGLLPLVVLLVCWQLLVNPHSPFYPPPSAWWKSLRADWNDGTLLPAIVATVKALLLSLAIAVVLGASIGIMLGASRRTDRAFGPTFEFMRSMPAATVVPIAALILGNNLRMNLTVVVFASIWPIILSTRAGMLNMNPLLVDVSKTLKLSRVDMYRKVVLPSLVPSILVGVSVAAPIALIVTLLVEILTASSGIGRLIALAQTQYNSPVIYGLAAVTGVLALLLSQAISILSHFNFRFETSRRA
jgi:ABC-type nitrate/sulfonate/bicarbonate transport system permease component